MIASATPMSLDLLTEMLLDCEARQLDLLHEVPMQPNVTFYSKNSHPSKHTDDSNSYSQSFRQGHRGHGRGWFRGKNRGNGRGCHVSDHNVNCVLNLDMWFNLVIIDLMKNFLV